MNPNQNNFYIKVDLVKCLKLSKLKNKNSAGNESGDNLCDPYYLTEEDDPEELLETSLRKVWDSKKYSKT